MTENQYPKIITSYKRFYDWVFRLMIPKLYESKMEQFQVSQENDEIIEKFKQGEYPLKETFETEVELTGDLKKTWDFNQNAGKKIKNTKKKRSYEDFSQKKPRDEDGPRIDSDEEKSSKEKKKKSNETSMEEKDDKVPEVKMEQYSSENENQYQEQSHEKDNKFQEPLTLDKEDESDDDIFNVDPLPHQHAVEIDPLSHEPAIEIDLDPEVCFILSKFSSHFLIFFSGISKKLQKGFKKRV